MLIKQISIFVENKLGRLAEVTKILADNSINMNAISISDTTDFGILRIIVDNPDKAFEVLKKEGFTVKSTDVIAVALSDEPGSLAKVLKILDKESIEIEYMYAFLGRKEGESPAVIRVEEPERALKILIEK